MSSVTYSFNLEPVASATTQRAGSGIAETSEAVAAKYQAAQPSGVQNPHNMAGMQSPACDGSTCFIVHGEGPGVTTLSVGEEDGGVPGDFLTLPVVDGVEFLAPPVTSFADAGQFDITTLAIGEEDGGVASAAPEIGSAQPSYEVIDANQQFALQPLPMIKPEMTVTTQIGQLSPIQTTPIVEPRMKPEVSAFAMAPITTAPAATPLPPIQTTPITAPRAKPTEIAAPAVPLPEVKPSTVAFAPAPAAAPIPATAPVQSIESAAQPAGVSGENFVSVGDYDSYIASLSAGDGTLTATTGGSEAVAVTEQPATPAQTTVTYAPPPLAPISNVIYAQPPLAPVSSITYAPPPAAPADAVDLPRMKPATVTLPGPAAAAPIETVPIETSPAVTTDPIQIPLQPAPAADSTTFNFSTIDTPMPAGKPEGASLDAPRLSEEDFRITTLALGEEDAGGG